MPYTIEYTEYYEPKKHHHHGTFKTRKAAEAHICALKKKYGFTLNIENKSRYIGAVHIKPEKKKKARRKKK